MTTAARARRTEHGAFIIDRTGTILAFDQGMEGLTGWPAIDVVGRNKDLGGSMSGGETGGRLGRVPIYDGDISTVTASRAVQLTLRSRDGRAMRTEASVRRLDGPGERLIVTVLRILARSAELDGADASDERRDTLTALPGPDAFASRLEAEFNLATAAAKPLALILIDVDHLREINDRHGRDAGDRVLQELAGILRVSVDDESRICRLGDDDFAVVLPDSGRGEARQLAAGLRSMVERFRFFTGLEGTRLGSTRPAVTISLGAASFPADAENGTDLLERARDALNEARSMGRNRVWCYLRRPRVPVEVPVFFDAAESLLVGYTRDLSPSGIFVQTSVPMEIGMRCALAFPLPGRGGRVHVIGRVVRTVPPEMALETQSVRIPGMGVEFERFGGTIDRRSIETFLHRHEGETERPERPPLSY